MPQDSFRYRSFVTCDDPKGVVEYRTIRKSKMNSQKNEGRVKSCRTQKNLNASSTCEGKREETVSKRIAEEFDNPSCCQLMEVSKGAHKLNGVIDSWSKGAPFDGNSKDIAKDLLKGALDLQESLIMLGKLQEASQYSAKLKRKQEKSERGRIDKMGGERMNSNPSEDHNNQMGFQNPRFSVDSSSRDGFEELRQVIRDSLARQNLLPNSSAKEKVYCDRRTLDSALDMPSTSSSHSSVDLSLKFSSSESSLSSNAAQKKPTGSNVIAKLMGLEEIPSKPLQSNSRKQLEINKVSKQRRHIFNIDMPKPRKPQFIVQRVDPEEKTLKEILECMQFKGVLKSNSDEGLKPPSCYPNSCHSNKRSFNDAPPIVIVKPLHFSSLEAETPRRQSFIWEDRALDSEEMLRKLKRKEELLPKTIDSRELVWSSNEMCRNMEAKEPLIKRLSQEEVKDCEEVDAKSEAKKVKTKEKLPSNKMKPSVTVNPKAKKESIEREVDKIHKVTPNRRKSIQFENGKCIGASRSLDQAKLISTEVKEPRKGSNILKNYTAQQERIPSNPTSRRPRPVKSPSSTNREKNSKSEKAVSEPLAAELNAETIGCKEVTKIINTMLENEPGLIRNDTASADQLLTEEGADFSDSWIKEHCINSQNSLCEVTLQTIQHESSIQSSEEASCYINRDNTEKKCFRTITNQKDLLLSNLTFLSLAEELFNINANQLALSQTVSVNDSGITDSRLFVDCANELMELKSLQCTRTVRPFLHALMQKSRTCLSLDQLVEEVCNEIENLRSCDKLAGENLPIESFYAVMERDLKTEGVMMSRTWDLGWRDGYTMSEVELVMSNIEKLVLSSLIEEVLADFVL
ncbi:uncharacterized protein LOC132277198 [Cornus florida]|uniref:uncharacterized protein LOC132277198 n=1 Tax=Cornus florida TaxID=4283 RepID=UPI00289A32B0|nr:uncharacterized protein LOC132277198 [Cornus florida]